MGLYGRHPHLVLDSDHNSDCSSVILPPPQTCFPCFVYHDQISSKKQKQVTKAVL